MVTVETDEGRVIAAGSWTRPYPLIVSPTSEEAAAALADHLADAAAELPGVVGATRSAEAFAAAWTRRMPCSCRFDTRFGLYQIDRVSLNQSAQGQFRAADDEDFAPLIPWAEAFYNEINEPIGDPKENLRRAISENRLFLWCDGGQVVSMAAWAGPTPNGIRVNFVYTPPQFRGRGHASNCVAALTKRLLDSGRRFVFLFTDMSNPTSNRIYQRIGYRYLGDQQKIMFDVQGVNRFLTARLAVPHFCVNSAAGPG